MTLSHAQRRVLEDLVEKTPESVEWCLFGSVDSVLRGLDEDPSDVDTLFTEEGAERLRERFADEFVGTREIGRSRIDQYRIRGEELEVIYADGEADGRLIDLEAVELRHVELEPASDLTAPVLPLDRLAAVYREIGRRDTAEKLEARFATE